MRTCPVCDKKTFVEVQDITLDIDGYIFILRGHRCESCKEEFPFEGETDRAIITARKLGVWPEPMKLYRHLSRSGGGLVLRVPSDLEKQLHLDESTQISISKMGNKIILEPVSG